MKAFMPEDEVCDISEYMQMIVNGDQDAYAFLMSFVKMCHLLDDVIDKDSGLTDTNLVQVWLDFTFQICFNSFFLKYKMSLHSLIVQSGNAWLTSNEWEQHEDIEYRRSADAMKSFYHEVLFHVAFLCGGFNHMRKVSAEREIDFDFKD